MDERAKIKSLVEHVVEAYLKEQYQVKKKTSIVILLIYQSTNPLKVLEAVKSWMALFEVTLYISKEWVPVTIPLQEGSYSILEETSPENLIKVVDQTDLIVFPVASYSLISKLALTMDDEIAVWLAIQYQLQGKPIIIANNGIEPSVYQHIITSHSVLNRIQSYIKQIQADQVKWVPLMKISSTIEEEKNAFQEKHSLILAKHIEKAHHDGINEITIPTKIQITPMARDLARQLNIEIKEDPNRN